jgi:biotin operon repressor
MNNKKGYKETHEQSKLFQFIEENVTNYKYWRGVYNHVILDSSLNTNDIIVYLNIYKLAYKKGNWFPISYWKLTRETNMKKANLSKCISKLEDKGYINRELNYKYSYSIPINRKTSMLQIPTEFFDNMLINKKLFVNTLRALMLSYGNDIVPSYSACVSKMGSLDKRYYSKLKNIHNGLSDVSLYNSLEDIEALENQENILIDYDNNEFAKELQDMLEEHIAKG